MADDTMTKWRDPAREIEELWDAERCSWSVRYLAPWWTVELAWAQEHGPHDSDWATFTWEFDAYDVKDALLDAADWCAELAPWRPCDDCGGRGVWDGMWCASCDRTGLANGGEVKEGADRG